MERRVPPLRGKTFVKSPPHTRDPNLEGGVGDKVHEFIVVLLCLDKITRPKPFHFGTLIDQKSDGVGTGDANE